MTTVNSVNPDSIWPKILSRWLFL